MGNPPLPAWLAEHPLVTLASFAEAAGRSELVVNATNPLDLSHGMPPTLFVSNTDSLAEQIQRAFPEARVVKSR